MTTFLKFTLSAFLAVTIGVGSAYASLWFMAKAGNNDPLSDNPYARAAFAARDLLPSEHRP
tara:strand:- start:6420 stop:6602 length:183 start_codon:yes stop_codon:yes gene_type:complete